MDLSSFCIAQVTRLLDRLAFAVHDAANSQTPEVVHDLRVAVRRFTQALVLGKPCFASHDMRKMRRRLKTLMGLAGEVRDCDIALSLVTCSRSKEAGALETKLRERRIAAEKTLVALLRQCISRNSFPKWRRALEECAPAPGVEAEAVAGRKLPRLRDAFFREGNRAAGEGASARQLHEFRLTAKKFRYTLELFAEFYGPAATGCVEQLRTAQNLLGSISDCAVTRRLVETLGAGTGMLAGLKRRQRRKTREFCQAWEEGLADLASLSFEHPPRKPMVCAEAQRYLSLEAQA